MKSIRDRRNDEMINSDFSIQNQLRNLSQKNLSNYNKIDPNLVQPLANYGIQTTQLDSNTLDSIDKNIESLTSLLLSKISDLEFLFTASTSKITVTTRNAFTNVIDIGSFIIQFNGIVRQLLQVGLSQSSRNSITTKLENLSSPLDAIINGLEQLINLSFTNGDITKSSFSYLRALAAYLFAKKCISKTQYMVITPQLIDSSYTDILKGFSQNKRTVLQSLLNANIDVKPLSQFPVFNGDTPERIANVEREYGIKFRPKEKLRIQNFNDEDARVLMQNKAHGTHKYKSALESIKKELKDEEHNLLQYRNGIKDYTQQLKKAVACVALKKKRRR